MAKLVQDVDVLRSENNLEIGNNREKIEKMEKQIEKLEAVQTEITGTLTEVKDQLDKVRYYHNLNTIKVSGMSLSHY